MNVLGIDLSSRAIDLVLLDENEDRAQWTHIDLPGGTAFDRARTVHDLMPQPSWYDHHGVYLCAIEQPFGASRRAQSVLMLVMGAVVASIPHDLRTWSVNVSTWKQQLGIGSRKPTWDDFPGFTLDAHSGGIWHGQSLIAQDALDALGVALYARDLNAEAVRRSLGTAS